MEWRIRECSNGSFSAEKGMHHSGGVLNPVNGIGYTMPAFIVYQSANFGTKKKAMEYIKRQK